MHLIKLDAIGSTNDYLKSLLQTGSPQDFTVVTAETQTGGRGQMGARWFSDPGKNLTVSILVRNPVNDVSQIFSLNAAVATAVILALENLHIPQLALKWPNDIMSGRKKIGGILIENSVKSAGDIVSVVGIGLNVNQLDFRDLPNASSLAAVTGKTFNKEQLLVSMVGSMQSQVSLLACAADKVWETFDRYLFRKGHPTAFEDASGARFMGIILKAGRDGKLHIALEDESVKTFGLKEVTMLY